jgi:hypothetical protein
MYRHKLEAELSGVSEPEPLSLEDKWKRMGGAVRKEATITMGYTRKQAGKEWFGEDCEKVKEDKNACGTNDTQIRPRTAIVEYRQARSKKRHLSRAGEC